MHDTIENDTPIDKQKCIRIEFFPLISINQLECIENDTKNKL